MGRISTCLRYVIDIAGPDPLSFGGIVGGDLLVWALPDKLVR